MEDDLKYCYRWKQFNLENSLKYFNLLEYLKNVILKDDLKCVLKWNKTSNIFVNENQPQII